MYAVIRQFEMNNNQEAIIAHLKTNPIYKIALREELNYQIKQDLLRRELAVISKEEFKLKTDDAQILSEKLVEKPIEYEFRRQKFRRQLVLTYISVITIIITLISIITISDVISSVPITIEPYVISITLLIATSSGVYTILKGYISRRRADMALKLYTEHGEDFKRISEEMKISEAKLAELLYKEGVLLTDDETSLIKK